SALSSARTEIMGRTLAVRSSLSSRAWQKVHLQPWLFGLVESYMASVVLSATRSRLALARRLLGAGPPASAGPSSPGRAYLALATTLLSRSVADLPSGRLAAFDAESTRVQSGRDLLPQLLSDRALLSQSAHAAPSETPLRSKLSRPVRVLVVVDP